MASILISAERPSPRRRSFARVLPMMLPLALVASVWVGTVSAFDTGPHFDITADVLRSEGFSAQAIKTVQCANFFVDFHEFMRKQMFRKVLDTGCLDRIADVLKNADDQHFDELTDATAVAQEWDTMLDATRSTAQAKSAKPDVLGLLAVLGASLHNVQDFYAHSNWVDGGALGPPLGQGALAKYGDHPTYLSMDRADREKLNVYTRGPVPAGAYYRRHGDWDTPVDSLGLNKDWAGRQHYRDAYICAYFATRQWVRLFRTFVGASAWAQMQQGNVAPYNPNSDWDYARKISFYGGHWNGNGGPTGLKDAFSSRTAGTSPDLLVPAVLGFMGGRCIDGSPSALRVEMMQLLRTWGAAAYNGPVDLPMPSPDPTSVTFAELELHKITAIDTGDGAFGGDLDWYSRARIGGQQYWSGLIDEHDNFDFDVWPYHAWTMIKAIPAEPQDEELTSLWVMVSTGTTDGAGTDDDIFLRLSDKLRFEFPYDPDNDDFENGSFRTYAFTLPGGIRVRDITMIRLEKPDNGRKGEWQLGGVKVTANGRPIYANPAINTWLDGKTRAWQASDFKPVSFAGTDVPVAFQLMELDYKNDDKEDINPFPATRGLGFVYAPDKSQVRGDVNGAADFVVEGKGDSDRARVRIKLNRDVGTCLK